MNRPGFLEALAAAVLFGIATPATSALAGEVPAFTLAGLLYLGAVVGVGPAVRSAPPTRRALMAEGQPIAVAVVAGGLIGPVLLMAGLARTSAASASLLLNTELVATVLLASLFFRERIDRRLLIGVLLVTLAGVWLVWQPGAAIDAGALLIVAACVCWGLDNNVTAAIEGIAPEHVVAIKGIVAGTTNLTIGLAVAGWGVGVGTLDVVAALAIGTVGYGLSITLWVKGARRMGAARAQVVFATAPFIGTAVAWLVLGETVETVQLTAFAVVAIGVALSLPPADASDGPEGSHHEHLHRHALLVHRHAHGSDAHHGPMPHR